MANRKRVIRGGALVAVIAAAAAGGWYWWTVARHVETTDDAYVASDISVISPKVEGYVREVRVADNQQVKEGEVLVAIDDRDFAAKVAQAEATVAAEEATVATIDSRLVLQKSLIEQAVAQVQSADAELNRALQDLTRYRGLVRQNFASHQRFEAVDADAIKASAALARAKAALAAERDQVGVLQAQRRQEEAKLEQARAALTLARNDLANTVIRAPVDGVVGNRGVRVGQYVKAGTQLLAVVPLPRVYVVANFKETQLAGIRPGQAATLRIDALPGAEFEGRVESFAPASGSQFSLLPPENATGNFTKVVQRVPVRIAVAPGNALAALLRPGLSVVVSIDTRDAGTPSTASIAGVARVDETAIAADNR
jgi:membrane fusion protein (multidrug efflux system)